MFSRHRSGITLGLLAVFLITSLVSTRRASAYTPKSPEVQAIVERAVKYLESDQQNSARWDPMMGTQMLVAYAVYKHRKNPNHPLVTKAIKRCVESLKDPYNTKIVYEIGVALSFLTEFEDPQSLQLAAQLYQRLLKLQKPNGSFAYAGEGDTSVTQYAILAMWSAKHAGLVDNWSDAPVERAANWLLRTQSPAGSWAYHGKDPGGYRRIPQDHEPSPTMWAAGAGSLYITADALNFRKSSQKNDSPFVAANKSSAKGRPTTTVVDHNYMWESLALADNHGRRMPLKTEWQYYYLYAMERYYSFYYEVNGITEPKSGAPWYNQGVELLRRTQRNDGSFLSKETNCPPKVDTALAVLFLLRSTKEKIHPPTSGIAIGGNSIPDDFRNAVLTDDGDVVAPTKSNKVEDLATLIRAMESEDFDADEITLTDFKITKEVTKSELDLFKEQVNHPNYNVRLSTVRALARQGLDSAPVLIYALSDPDNRIMVEARNSLRRISRKLQGFGLPPNASEEQKKIAQRKWSQWLRSVRPDLEF